MNKGMQTKVRVLSETIIENLYDRMASGGGGDVQMGMIVAYLEVARQLSLVSEELHRMNRMLEEKWEAKP